MKECMDQCNLTEHWDKGCASKTRCVRAVREWAKDCDFAEANARPSLQVYRRLGQLGCGKAPAAYLLDRTNVKGTRLLTFARLDQLLLMGRVAKMLGWPNAGGFCMMCNLNKREDIEHFLVICPFLSVCRQKLLHELKRAMDCLGAPGLTLYKKYTRGGDATLEILLGQDHPELDEWAKADREGDAVRSMSRCARARWWVDKLVKNYILTCWRLRESVVGKIRIVAGRLVVVQTGSDKRVRELVARQTSHEELQPMHTMHVPLSKWLPLTAKKLPRPGMAKGRAVFYVVFRGRETGLFYKWEDCERVMKRFPKPRVKGFKTLDKALAAWQKHLNQ
jgi:hypothetical protein